MTEELRMTETPVSVTQDPIVVLIRQLVKEHDYVETRAFAHRLEERLDELFGNAKRVIAQ